MLSAGKASQQFTVTAAGKIASFFVAAIMPFAAAVNVVDGRPRS
ncbi:hypothetical protein [Brevibacillus choshinensis]